MIAFKPFVCALAGAALVSCASAATVGVLGADAPAAQIVSPACPFALKGAGTVRIDCSAPDATVADIRAQAERLKAVHAAGLDALVVYVGGNDYAAGVPLGAWWTESSIDVDKNGAKTTLRRRVPQMDAATFRGRLNASLGYLRGNFPDQPVFLVTPSLGAACTTPNAVGALPGDYAAAVREAANVWAVTVLDLAGAAPVTTVQGK